MMLPAYTQRRTFALLRGVCDQCAHRGHLRAPCTCGGQSPGMSRRRIILGFAVSAFFLFFALRGQDYAAIREAFSQVTYWYLIPALGLYFLGLLVRAYRWSVLLRPVEQVSPRTLVGINAVGLMANNVLPLRTGEFVRAYALSQKTTVTKSTAMATIAVERIFDGMTLLIFIATSMLFVDLTSQLSRVAELAMVIFGRRAGCAGPVGQGRPAARSHARACAWTAAGFDERSRQSHGGIIHFWFGNLPQVARACPRLDLVIGRLGLRSVHVLHGRPRIRRANPGSDGHPGNDAHHWNRQSRDACSLVSRVCRPI